MRQLSRRDALRLGVVATAVPPALAGTSTAKAAAPAERAAAQPGTSWVVEPFANNEVTLGPSLFSANRDRILNFARGYPADRMLAVFRANAGLDTLGAQPPGGWETATGNLRGHYAGHFLSFLALAYAGWGETALKKKLDYMGTALGQCKAPLNEKVGHPAPPPPPVGRTP